MTQMQITDQILIVDDDPMFRLMLEKFLSREGFSVRQAASGEEALTSFEEHPALMVLLDANMPGMSGFSCCERLQQLAHGPDTPILMLTALDDESFVDRAFAAGASDYLTKPIQWAVLRNRLHYLREMRHARQAQRLSEARKSAILHSALDCILTVDNEGVIREFNPAASRTFGYSRDEVSGRCHIHGLVPVLDSLPDDGKARSGLLNVTREAEGIRRDGSRFPIEMALSHSESDESGFYTLILRDIGPRKRAEHDLKLAATVLENTSEAVMITDANNLIRSVNPAFTAITGYKESEVIGRSPGLLSSGRHGGDFYQQMWTELNAKGVWQGEVWNRRKDGQEFPEWLAINTVTDAISGEVNCHIALFSDITDRKAYEENIWYQANYDSLTKLPNRNHFRTCLKQAIERCSDGTQPLALMFIDLDHFKEINDTLGHSYGDRLLVEAGERLKLCVREQDVVARLGGDEFTVILPTLANASVARRIGEQILFALSQPFELIEGRSSFVSASVGITFYPDDALDSEMLISYADTAMYRSKEQGRNQLTFFEPTVNLKQQKYAGVAADIRRGLADREFMVVFQPVVDLRTGGLTGAEALVRWQHPEKGVLRPASFLSLAEESGLVIDLDRQVLEQVLAQLSLWRTERFYPRVTVNISEKYLQLPNRALLTDITRFLESYQLPPDCLMLDLNEQGLMDASQAVRDQLHELRRFGVEICVDDFGAGYCVLNCLRTIEVDSIKLDLTLISRLLDSDVDQVMAESFVRLADALKLKVVAEGVETQEQANAIQQLSCDYGQGCFYGEPLAIDRFSEQWLVHSLREESTELGVH